MHFREDYGATGVGITGNFDYGAEFGSFDASGFTVTTRNAGANDDDMIYLALSFGGAVEGWVGTVDTPTSTGDSAKTGVGFTPALVLMGMTYAEAVDTTYGDANGGTLGFSVFDADDEFAMSWGEEDAAATTNNQSLSDNTAVELPDDDGAAGLTGAFTSMDADGFTINYSAVEAAAKKFWAVAIEEEAVAVIDPPDWAFRKTRQNVQLRM